MPIFAFLFGYSLVKMKEGLNAKGLKFGRHIVRRSLLLILLGFLHSYFLWEGDVLLFYGGFSFFLLMFVNRKPKTLAIWGCIFLLASGVLSYGTTGSQSLEEKQRIDSYVSESIPTYSTGSFGDIMQFRMNADPLGLPDWFGFAMFIIAPLFVGALFLFGMAAAKSGMFMSPSREKEMYMRRALLLVPVGIVAKTAGIMLGEEHPLSEVLSSLGGQILALGYIFAFALAYAHSSKRSIIIRSFEAVGRMSLTNYLMQTVICVFIFYGFGLGLFGKLGIIPGILLALVIYAVQAAFSFYILNRFRIGPVERLLRIGTYWSWSGRPKTKQPALNPEMTSA
ncbi:DUF418 domain-containing protein [Paenibacillus sp. DMB20]|uniref:DUF418 domain-containing protein n=1 Tax=Paenibacillus sp. DMB20 TaxID=1642570 RepID=UPI001F2A6591|nr:DUF418 domain-containing protein [Paenibacillus sp. DMB20]